MRITANDGFKITGECLVEIHDAKTGRLKFSKLYKNLFVTTGKYQVAQALRGNVEANVGQISYCAVGTGTNVPALADVQLQTEIARKQVSVRSALNAQATFQTFFNQDEANGVLREAGLFGASATVLANSGVLFCRLNLNRTKTASDTLTLTWGVTVG